MAKVTMYGRPNGVRASFDPAAPRTIGLEFGYMEVFADITRNEALVLMNDLPLAIQKMDEAAGVWNGERT